MRKSLMVALLGLALAGCGADKATTAKLADMETRNHDLEERVAKLERRLDEAEKSMVAQQQTIGTLSDRLRTAEAGIDKLAYGSAAH
jgi:chromosome segregation ATPase